ncbi:MAG: methyltransferase domain-containing protein [Candidatus Omnitrophica bacterium]|nr:methyltransferase domain-containing protein [Candidatus Omnitrophota bacterium]
MLNKEQIKKSFSKAAITYDKASDFQKETGRRLVDMILSDTASEDMILDIGMGTGSITQELAGTLNRRIYGCDLSWGMVSFAKKNTNGLFISQADMEELPYKTGAFDIIFSNITYQWAHDAKPAFLEIKRILKNGGRFYFSILIKDSLKELYETVKGIAKKDQRMDFLPSGESIKSEFTESGLKIAWCEEKTLKKYYDSSLALLKTLKRAGAGKILDGNVFKMGQRRLFFEMLEAYDRNFNEGGKVFANYNVIFGCAKKI